MSKKTRSKKSRRGKSDNIAIRKSYVYAGVAVLAILIVAAVVFLSSSPNTTATVVAEALSPAQYQEQFGSGSTDHLLLDVRTPEEFAAGHIEGAVNLNVETLAQHLDQIPQDKPVVVYCRSGNRSEVAQGILVSAGYPVVYDLGGIIDWQSQGFTLTQ